MRTLTIAPLPFAALLVTFAVAGCAADATGAPGASESTATENAAVSVAGGAIWGTPGNSGPDLKLGPTATQTCFLSGVSGSLQGNPAYYSSPDDYLAASAGVYEDNGTWFVRTRAGTGPGVEAYVTCVNATANRVFMGWQDNLVDQGVPATANRRCFLKEVWATSGMTNGGTFESQFVVKKRSGQWDLNDSYVYNTGGDMEFGGVTAVCVDLPAGSEWTIVHIGPTNGQNSATATFTLGAPVGDAACGLTGIRGGWWSPPGDPLGWSDGAFLIADASKSKDWRMTVSNGREGDVTCLE